MFFKKKRLAKTDGARVKSGLVIPQTPQESLMLLGRRYKNMVVLEVDRSPRYALARAVGYALVGKLPVVMGPASLLRDGAAIVHDMIVDSGLNVKFVVSEGEVVDFPPALVCRADSSEEIHATLGGMMERFGPECCVL